MIVLNRTCLPRPVSQHLKQPAASHVTSFWSSSDQDASTVFPVHQKVCFEPLHYFKFSVSSSLLLEFAVHPPFFPMHWQFILEPLYCLAFCSEFPLTESVLHLPFFPMRWQFIFQPLYCLFCVLDSLLLSLYCTPQVHPQAAGILPRQPPQKRRQRRPHCSHLRQAPGEEV